MSLTSPSPAPLEIGDGPVDQFEVIDAMCGRHFDLIRLADQKAQFLLRLTLMLFGIAFIGIPPSVIALKRFMTDGGWHYLALFVSVGILYFVCATCLLVALAKVISAVRPRILTQGQFPTRLLFASIARQSPNEFRATLSTLKRDELLDEMMGQAYQSSVIAWHKLQKLREAIGWLMGGGLVGVMFALILLVSHGLTGPSDAADSLGVNAAKVVQGVPNLSQGQQ